VSIFDLPLEQHYERVDVCRFHSLVGCERKFLRTPYFFQWHYVLLVLYTVAALLEIVVIVTEFCILVLYSRIKSIRLHVVAALMAVLACRCIRCSHFAGT